MDVGRDGDAPGGHGGADGLRLAALGGGNSGHLRRDDAGAGEIDLSDRLCAASAATAPAAVSHENSFVGITHIRFGGSGRAGAPSQPCPAPRGCKLPRHMVVRSEKIDRRWQKHCQRAAFQAMRASVPSQLVGKAPARAIREGHAIEAVLQALLHDSR